MHEIPVFKPLITEQEINAATESLRIGWLGMGAAVGEFEQHLSDYLGLQDRHLVAVSTGHAALHLAMMLIEACPGDEIITPSFNNIADFQAILAVGATPVFCDIDERTLCIDLVKAEALITPRTKAIIVMDYDCCLADHDQAARLAEQYGIRIIHDAAHSLGSAYKGRKVGTFSDLCMFSFDPVKTITTIDGGALVVRSEAEKQVLHEMRLIGMGQPAAVMYENKRAWTYDVQRLGFRYHLANLHAAIGLVQLTKMPAITYSRQQTCKRYNEHFGRLPLVQVPHSDFNDVTPFLYYIRVPAEHRQPLRDYMKADGIDTGIHWQPGHYFALLKDMPRGKLEVTEQIASEILSLPLHSMMSEDDVLRVITSVTRYFEA
ncbi:dTDP-4-amino-4,6-dideoxygalactose transaminase [Rheinheimera pacifica]|uniref:DegT/DnrJ/EryC1/StrS family aminotransferase n=1 Tax=Rheinheimera pacifica TaxID=173990 RepID=UPI00216AA6E2|nr:DegT/DnrJ/EryC1/StrS family aminotransferase [Rheinheimera pacifica]MCS4309435.1 dTDP-4-amino-4,6-dideoxygalactose transaminase [Rheinheimera pacifica]